MKKTRKEALETRERVLNSAEFVFFHKGVTHTTLADIAAAAGVTRGAVYGHFKNKIDVFDAMVNRVQLPMEAFVEAATDPLEMNPLDRIRTVLVMCLSDVAQNPRTHRVFNVLFTKCEYSMHMSALLERTTMAASEGRELLARGLRNAVEKGQLPEDLDVVCAAAALHAMIGGVLRDWLLDAGSVSLPADAKRIVDASLDMLRFSTALRTRRPKAKPKQKQG